MKQLSTKSDKDKIIEYLLNPDDETILTQKLREKVDLLQEAADILRKYNCSPMTSADKLASSRKISKVKALRICNEANKIFGIVFKPNRDFFLNNLIEDLGKAYRAAIKAKDSKLIAALIKERRMLLKEQFGENAPEYENLQVPDINIGFFPELIGLDMPNDLEAELEKLKIPKENKLDTSLTDFEDATIVDE